jgi:hypothetical protein
MKERTMLGIRLDSVNFKKLKEFSIKNYISTSEIFRVLIEKSKIKLANTRPASDVILDAKKNKELHNKYHVTLYLNQKLINKLDDMRIENNISYSEIGRCLVQNADFFKMEFKTINEVLKNTESKYKRKDNIHIMLDMPTRKKLKEFSIKNFVSGSELVRALIKKSDVKINVKDRGTVQRDGLRSGKTDKKYVLVCLDEESQEKLNKMKIENNATYSEIIRYLFENADFSKMKFKTKDEVYSTAFKEKKSRAKQQPKPRV